MGVLTCRKALLFILLSLAGFAFAETRDRHCGRWISRQKEPIAPDSMLGLSPHSLEALDELIDALENMDWNVDEAAGYVDLERAEFVKALRTALLGHDGRIFIHWPPGSSNLREIAFINFKRLDNLQLLRVIRLFREHPAFVMEEKNLRRMEKELAERPPENEFYRLRDVDED